MTLERLRTRLCKCVVLTSRRALTQGKYRANVKVLFK